MHLLTSLAFAIMRFFKQQSENHTPLYIATATLSALLSIYAIATNDVINNDGILYIQTAGAFLEGGISKTMTVFSWPFFPIIIAWFHTLTGVSLEASAYAVNAILLIILSITFIKIYEEISAPKLPLWAPALFILALPIVNDYRAYIIRGHGFWTFTLLALLFFIRYSKQPTVRSALLWQLCTAIGTLFRIEGVVFLALAPFYFLFAKEDKGTFLRHFIRLNSVLIPTTIAAIIVLFSYILKMDGISSGLQLRLSYMLPSSMLTAITEAASKIETLSPYMSSSGSVLFVISGLIALVAFKLIKNINLVYLSIWLFGRHRQWIQLKQQSNIVLFFAFISILPLIALAGNQFFMSSRYTVLSVILFSLISYQYLDYLLDRLTNNKMFLATATLVTLMIVFFLDAIIHTGANKHNLVIASNWVSNSVNTNARIACDNSRFAYYTDQRCVYEKRLGKKPIEYTEKLINKGRYDHLLFWLSHKDKQIKNYLDSNRSLVLLQAFENSKGDEARIYKIQKHEE